MYDEMYVKVKFCCRRRKCRGNFFSRHGRKYDPSHYSYCKAPIFLVYSKCSGKMNSFDSQDTVAVLGIFGQRLVHGFPVASCTSKPWLTTGKIHPICYSPACRLKHPHHHLPSYSRQRPVARVCRDHFLPLKTHPLSFDETETQMPPSVPFHTLPPTRPPVLLTSSLDGPTPQARSVTPLPCIYDGIMQTRAPCSRTNACGVVPTNIPQAFRVRTTQIWPNTWPC